MTESRAAHLVSDSSPAADTPRAAGAAAPPSAALWAALSSRPRDPWSSLTHLAGAALSVVGLVALLLAAAAEGNVWHTVSFAIFGSSLILLYLSSGLYHALPLSPEGVLRMRRLDHIMIFLLIAGTYTPFCLTALRGPWGWSLFGIVWGIAAGGIAMKIWWLQAPRWITAGVYLGMGWVIIVAIVPLVRVMPAGGLFWLVGGGLAYSGGAVIYALKRPNPWPGVFGFHEVWHLFVMAGSACHFVGVYRYLLPLG